MKAVRWWIPAEVVAAVWEGGGGWGDSGPSPGMGEESGKLLSFFR